MSKEESTSTSIILSLLIQAEEEVRDQVRDLRNEEGVRKWMFTQHVISTEEHKAWLKRLEKDGSQLVFLVRDEDSNLLGVVSVNKIDRVNRKCEWAYYLGEKARGGLGAAIEYFLTDFIFERLGFLKINGEIIEGNDRVLRLHEKFLYKEEGFRSSELARGDERIGIHFFGLERETWRQGREEVWTRHRRVFEKYRIRMDWNPEGAF